MTQSTDTVSMSDPTCRTAFLAMLESVLNRTLALDPVTQKKLAVLEGAAVNVQCLEPEFQCYLFIESGTVRLAGWHEGEVDGSVSGSSVAWLELASRRSARFADVAGLQAEGNEELFTQLEEIHREMELDWEAVLCQRLGDVAGHAVGQGVRFIASRLQRIPDAVSENLGGYLQEELNVAPSAAELRGFNSDVELLRKDVERLETRIAELNHQANKKTGV